MQVSDEWGLYGALGGVAAITTALQAAVALQPLNMITSLRPRKRDAAKGTAEFNTVVRDAERARLSSILLNIPATIVNAAVLASWARPALFAQSLDEWEVWIPWVAVAAAAAFLFVSAVVGIHLLNGIAKK